MFQTPDSTLFIGKKENHEMRKLVVTVVVLFVLTVGFHRLWGPFYYESDAIRAQVINEETGQPVGGAVVVAIWMLDSSWYTDRPLHASEAVTDGKGNFVIPAMRERRPWLMFLDFRDPQISIYKPGYRIEGVDNRDLYIRPFVQAGDHVRTTTLPDGRIMAAPATYSSASKRPSYWNGRTIPMKPLAHDDKESHLEAFEGMLSKASFHSLSPNEFPNLWRTLVNEYRNLPTPPRNLASPQDYIAHWKEREP
jgi:hypothetical protein